MGSGGSVRVLLLNFFLNLVLLSYGTIYLHAAEKTRLDLFHLTYHNTSYSEFFAGRPDKNELFHFLKRFMSL